MVATGVRYWKGTRKLLRMGMSVDRSSSAQAAVVDPKDGRSEREPTQSIPSWRVGDHDATPRTRTDGAIHAAIKLLVRHKRTDSITDAMIKRVKISGSGFCVELFGVGSAVQRTRTRRSVIGHTRGWCRNPLERPLYISQVELITATGHGEFWMTCSRRWPENARWETGRISLPMMMRSMSSEPVDRARSPRVKPTPRKTAGHSSVWPLWASSI